jgi:hypothetical protein
MPTSTEDHPQPSVPGAAPAVEALVVAFPVPRAVPLPKPREAVGRAYFTAFGVQDRQISTSQARFSRAGGVRCVEDAGSRNGTWVDGTRLAPGERRELPDGSVLRIGNTLFIARDELAGPMDPAPPLGETMVGPYGLRDVAEGLRRLESRPVGNVLVEGDTGAGKELVAALVARALGRASPYGAVNIAGVAESVFESQLFGHVPGAFSGALAKGSRGLLAAYAGGTVFLDEIGELPLSLQPKLLRAIEYREALPVGAERAVKIDVAIVAATNRDLDAMVEAGAFRRDLLLRLSQTRLRVPSLSDRPEDIFAILQARLREPLPIAGCEVEAVERLLLHPWPGNVREMISVVDQIVGLGGGRLTLAAAERLLGAAVRRRALSVEEVRAAVEACGGSKHAAARRLGVSRGKVLRILGRG